MEICYTTNGGIMSDDIDTLVGRIHISLSQIVSIAEKDYLGMREFQAKFIKADGELRELRDLLRNGISTADQLPEKREIVVLWGPECNCNGQPFVGYRGVNKWYDTSDWCEGYDMKDITRWWPLPKAPKEDLNG